MKPMTRRSPSGDQCCEVCGCHSVKYGLCDRCKEWQKILSTNEELRRVRVK